MTIQNIIELALFRTNTSKSFYPANYCEEQLNRIYKKVYRAIVEANENFFWNEWTTDILEDATEYSIIRTAEHIIDPETEEETWVIPGISRVIKVSLKDSNWEYQELHHLAEGETCKWWVLKDNHIILNFVPKEDIEDWLKIEGIEALEELDSEYEWQLFPWHDDLQEFQYLISLWLEYEMWRAKQDFDKANIALQEYQADLQELIKYVTPRTHWIYFSNVK